MKQIVYVNGVWMPSDQAQISIFDRGFLFADGAYEVTTVLEGRLVDNARHLARLRRSLEELSIPMAWPVTELEELQQDLISRNALDQGTVYIQITRGQAPRSFDAPADPKPSLVGFTTMRDLLGDPKGSQGIRVMLLPDIRWKRRDIKVIGLLAPSLAKMEATRLGFDEAWMVEDGLITEGTSNNAYIVDQRGTIITRPVGPEILPGITRHALLDIARAAGYAVEERPFSPDEAKTAQEAFLSSASTFVYPVIEIDDTPVGSSAAGPVALDLRQRYIEAARSGLS